MSSHWERRMLARRPPSLPCTMDTAVSRRSASLAGERAAEGHERLALAKLFLCSARSSSY